MSMNLPVVIAAFLLLAAPTLAEGPEAAPASNVDAASASTSTSTSASTSSASASIRPLRIAVTDLSVQAVDPRIVSVFRESLLVEVRKLQRVSVLGADEVRAMLDLEAQKQLTGCSEANSCLAELADALGADAVIVGGIVQLGGADGADGETVLTLKRVDQKSASVSQQTSKRLKSAGGEELIAVIGTVVAELFPEVPLREGQVRGVSDELAVLLHPPPLPTWAWWTTVGASGVLASSTLVAGAWWAASQQGFRDIADQARQQATPGLAVKERQDTLIVAETTTWVCAGSAIVAAVAAAAMVPFVDWDNAAAGAP
jgi:hypothetical protein